MNNNLLVEIIDFQKKKKTRKIERKTRKKDIQKNIYTLFKGKERVLDAFGSKIFQIKIKGTGFSDRASDNLNLKTLTRTK